MTATSAIDRKRYYPEYHKKHKTRYTLADKVYLARYFEHDGARLMSAALERPVYAILQIVQVMRKSGEWEMYKNLTDEEYEKIILTEERRRGVE